MLRETFFTDPYTILLVICLVFVALSKLLFFNRFQSFVSLLVNFKYLKVYARDYKFFNLFDALLFVNFILGLTIFTVLSYKLTVDITKTDFLFVSKLVIGFSVFIILKMVLELLFSKLLKANQLIKDYVFQKLSYRNFYGIMLIAINSILIFLWNPSQINVSIFVLLFSSISVYGLTLFIKNNLNAIKKNWFYFILYLCALEISPYVVLYKIYTE